MQQFYDELDFFINDLRENNYIEFANRLKSAMNSGCMAGEIIGFISLELEKYPTIIKAHDHLLIHKAESLQKKVKLFLSGYK